MIEITSEYLASQGLSETFPERFWAKVDKNGPVPPHCPELGPCWVWTACTLNGYGYIGTGRYYGPPIKASIAVWLLHFGPIPKGQCVCHSCDNRACVRPGHLWLGTKADNALDMIKKGRSARGPRRWNTKLTDDQVREIRNRYIRKTVGCHGNAGLLASEFGISTGYLSTLITRSERAHVS